MNNKYAIEITIFWREVYYYKRIEMFLECKCIEDERETPFNCYRYHMHTETVPLSSSLSDQIQINKIYFRSFKNDIFLLLFCL